MREILFKAKQIDNGKWVEGYYYKMSETTYCFKEDYERKPVPEHHYILQERMTDWGLPNQMIQIEVDPRNPLPVHRTLRQIWKQNLGERYCKDGFGCLRTGQIRVIYYRICARRMQSRFLC